MQKLFGNKNTNDSKEFEQIVDKKKLSEVVAEKESIQSLLNSVQQELDKSRADNTLLAGKFTGVQGELNLCRNERTTEKAKLDGQIKEQLQEIEKLKSDLEKSIKNGKLMADENLKLRQRIQRIKNKRFRIEDNQKICKKCTREYLEKENFNWSCKTHQSEWSNDA
jgi:hypothetical protein